ncbi:probable ATP-dependent RNA helicase DDX31 isoform X1 [Haliotis rufescens]|uniref:probable ATP-dependent RNA helicase DDX31 isoform X1 n=1 Tax=Haliotis rufescens TaxID=6454 RepID=UPI00201EFE8D|nr:probable ATP-dependent RNA helicase DDX31 isoform X1 [Haliotis rufescens]
MMDSSITLNLAGTNLQVGDGSSQIKSKITGNRVKRIKGRRQLKRKQRKFKDSGEGGSGDTSDGEGVAGSESADTREAVDTQGQKTGDGRSRKRKPQGDNIGNVLKKTKSGHSGQIVSSLFRYNPDIPKVASSQVTECKEAVFSSDSFSQLSLHPHMVQTLEERLQLTQMTAVQQQAIPTILQGQDALVKSQTGSGKTLAFAVPIVQKLQALEPAIVRADGPYAIVVVPTRELAQQCLQVFTQLVKPFIRIVPGLVIGGEKRKAEKASIRKGINIMVCTPGRLVDHLENTASLRVDRVEFLVLDEADRLCDLGYEKHIAQIVTALNTRSNHGRQTILLSATLSDGVERMAGISMEDPKHISLSDRPDANTTSSSSGAAESHHKAGDSGDTFTVPQNLQQYFVITPSKLKLVTLAAFILGKLRGGGSKMVVFMATQDAVEFHHHLFTKTLSDIPGRDADNLMLFRLHGDMEQKDRTEVYQTFSKSDRGVLLCTDVAARGLHLAHVQWIVQYTIPTQEAEYIHRVGRTARAGAKGESLLFLLPSEVDYLQVLNKHNISLKEIKMNRVLACLMKLMADLATDGEVRPRDLVESATHLQMRFENSVQGHEEMLSLARRGFKSFIRAYATYPQHLKSILKIHDLHLGHVAKMFGLREAPGGIGDRAGHRDIKKHKQRPGAPRRKKLQVSEFDSGFTKTKAKRLGPKKKKNKKKKIKGPK